jgi:hypothetical protein
MLKQSCFPCKIVGLIAIIGCLNWVLVGFFEYNLVESLLGIGTIGSKIVYGLVGLAGLMLLASYFIVCPCCKKSCSPS